MYRAVVLAVLGACLALVPRLPAEARTQERPKPCRKSKEAAKWLAATEGRFALSLENCGCTLLFVIDKRAVVAGQRDRTFVLTVDEAAGIVQTLVDCGLWGRSDQLPLGPIPPGRYLTLGPSDTQQSAPWWWHLGDCSDDVGSMVIIQHLLEISSGDRQRAIMDWLSHGQSTEP